MLLPEVVFSVDRDQDFHRPILSAKDLNCQAVIIGVTPVKLFVKQQLGNSFSYGSPIPHAAIMRCSTGLPCRLIALFASFRP